MTTALVSGTFLGAEVSEFGYFPIETFETRQQYECDFCDIVGHLRLLHILHNIVFIRTDKAYKCM